MTLLSFSSHFSHTIRQILSVLRFVASSCPPTFQCSRPDSFIRLYFSPSPSRIPAGDSAGTRHIKQKLLSVQDLTHIHHHTTKITKHAGHSKAMKRYICKASMYILIGSSACMFGHAIAYRVMLRDPNKHGEANWIEQGPTCHDDDRL